MTQTFREFQFDKLPKLHQLPLPTLQYAVDQVVTVHKVPRKLALYTAVFAACALAQLTFDVEKPAGGVVPVGVYGLLQGKSGLRKTKVDECFFGPFRSQIKRERQRLAAQRDRDETEMKIWVRKEKALLRQLDKAFGQGADTTAIELKIAGHESRKPKSRYEQLIFNDATIAALKNGLWQSKNAILLASDGKKMLRDLLLPHDADFNQLWSNEEVAVNRVTAQNYVLEDARLTFSVMIQDESLTRLMKDKGGQAQESGFFARVIFSDVGGTIGERLIEAIDTSQTDLAAYQARFETVLSEYMSAKLAGVYQRAILKLSPEAQRAWIAYYNYVESHTKIGGRFAKVIDHASKLADNVARLAAGLHVLEGRSGDIDLDCLLSAIALCDEASTDYVKQFGPKDLEQIEADAFKMWLVEKFTKKNEDFVGVTWLLQHGPNRMRNAKLIHRYLEILEEQGYLRVCAPRHKGEKTFVQLNMDGLGKIRLPVEFWNQLAF